MKCPEQSADGKTVLHPEKWKQGGTTALMRRHIMRHHSNLVDGPEPLSPKLASHLLYREKWSASKCLQFTKKMTYNLVVQDK
jgi:hypothetical protein